MELRESAYFYARERVVGLFVETREPGISPAVFSGFIVELEDRWYLTTAAHCAQEVSKGISNSPHTIVSLVSYGEGGNANWAPIEKNSWNYIDFQQSFAALVKTNPEAGFTENDVEHFDLAIWLIPDTLKCYLINNGVRAFSEGDVLIDDEQLLYRPNKAMYMVGFPSVNQEMFPLDMKMAIELKSFGLHPSPDDEDSDEPRKIESINSHCSWMPTCWDKQYWDNSVVGISGGPVIIATGERCYIAGLVTHQRSKGRNPSHVAICAIDVALEYIKEHPDLLNIDPPLAV